MRSGHVRVRTYARTCGAGSLYLKVESAVYEDQDMKDTPGIMRAHSGVILNHLSCKRNDRAHT